MVLWETDLSPSIKSQNQEVQTQTCVIPTLPQAGESQPEALEDWLWGDPEIQKNCIFLIVLVSNSRKFGNFWLFWGNGENPQFAWLESQEIFLG